MKIIRLFIVLLIIIFMSFPFLNAQDRLCKVAAKNLEGDYKGDCKYGLANGQGEAKGIDRYVGSFKDGMPNGKGTYYYADTVYYKGNFQNGIKEGKGEMHYTRKGASDSVIKGYWSTDVFRGEKYSPYKLSTSSFFDRTEVIPSDHTGNTVTIEIATSSGSPNGAPTHANSAGFNSGYILSLSALSSPTNSILKTGAKYESSFKSSITYELTGFPCRLIGTFSNGEGFDLELFKAADWKVRFFVNK
jgi:hypothetical protein